MHLNPLHPRQLLLLGALTMLAALFVLAVAAPDLSTLDFSIGGGGDAVVAPQTPGEPAWVADPLASPVQTLRGG